MLFGIQLLKDSGGRTKHHVASNAEFEAEDLYSVVIRTRIILCSNGYEPDIDAFRITTSQGEVLYYERRGANDVEDPMAGGSELVALRPGRRA